MDLNETIPRFTPPVTEAPLYTSSSRISKECYASLRPSPFLLSCLLTSCSCSLSLFILDLRGLFFYRRSTRVKANQQPGISRSSPLFFPSIISRSRFSAYENLVLIVLNLIRDYSGRENVHRKIYYEENTIPRDFYFSSISFSKRIRNRTEKKSANNFSENNSKVEFRRINFSEKRKRMQSHA